MKLFNKQLLALLIFFLCSFVIHAQDPPNFNFRSLKFNLRVNVGYSYLIKKSNLIDYSDEDLDHFNNLRQGISAGGKFLVYYKKVGIGINYHHTIHSGDNWEYNGNLLVNERLLVRYLGAVFSVKETFKRYHQVIFDVTLGKQVFRNRLFASNGNEEKGTFDGVDFELSGSYNYEIADGVTIGGYISYLGGITHRRDWVSKIVGSNVAISAVNRDAIDVRRLMIGITAGVSF